MKRAACYVVAGTLMVWAARAQPSAKAKAQTPNELYQSAKDGNTAALQQLNALAESGNVIAQNDLGAMYYYGESVIKDAQRAATWYRKAAEQGNSDAQYSLGALYAAGDGVPRDAAEAVVWYRKAAAQGDADAQLQLGEAYDNGRGLARDAAQAEAWYHKAAIQGNETAQIKFDFLQKKFIPLTLKGGVFQVPVLINNAITLSFIVDSGATDVSIPSDVVLTLMRTGTIDGSDFIGKKNYVLADGSMTPSNTFRIRSLAIAGMILENVTGSVGNPEGDLLLGQSFLGRFKLWSIDNTRPALILQK